MVQITTDNLYIETIDKSNINSNCLYTNIFLKQYTLQIIIE